MAYSTFPGVFSAVGVFIYAAASKITGSTPPSSQGRIIEVQ
jgi:hypothetical protein